MKFFGAILFLIQALTPYSVFAAQSGAPSRAAGDVSERVQAAYRAGASAVANGDFKTAEVQF
jgi:hypothetical protein